MPSAFRFALTTRIPCFSCRIVQPKYNKTAEETSVVNVTLDEMAPWAFDWKKDATTGMIVADKYASIGDAIEVHYKGSLCPRTRC